MSETKKLIKAEIDFIVWLNNNNFNNCKVVDDSDKVYSHYHQVTAYKNDKLLLIAFVCGPAKPEIIVSESKKEAQYFNVDEFSNWMSKNDRKIFLQDMSFELSNERKEDIRKEFAKKYSQIRK